MDVEPGPEFANFGLKLDDLGLQRHNEPEQLGTFGAAGSGYRQGVTHVGFSHFWRPKTAENLAFLSTFRFFGCLGGAQNPNESSKTSGNQQTGSRKMAKPHLRESVR